MPPKKRHEHGDDDVDKQKVFARAAHYEMHRLCLYRQTIVDHVATQFVILSIVGCQVVIDEVGYKNDTVQLSRFVLGNLRKEIEKVSNLRCSMQLVPVGVRFSVSVHH